MQFTVVNRTLSDNFGRVPYYEILLETNDKEPLTIKCTASEGKNLTVGTVLELKPVSG